MRQKMSISTLIAIVSLSVVLISGGRSTALNEVDAAESLGPQITVGTIAPGMDLFMTPCGGASFQDFSTTPIPADFFDPGSDPFTARINFGGVPLAPSSPLGPTDTIVQRMQPATVPNPGDSDTIPIEIVALSLVSCNPITVTYNRGQLTEPWTVSVRLSSSAQTQGSMTIRNTCTFNNGGTFNSTLPVLPRLVFTRIRDNTQQVLDFGVSQFPPIIFNTTDSLWLPVDPGFGLIAQGNFFPGVGNLPCQGGRCNRFETVKRMTQENALLAAHGVLPAQQPVPDSDGDAIPDDADNCLAIHNPLQEDMDRDGKGDVCDRKPDKYDPCVPPRKVR